MTTVEVLKAARARIERGWCQYSLTSGDDVCALGAIIFSAEPSQTRNDAVHALSGALGDKRIGDWNDAPGRTQAEVLQAFDKAIALADAATSRDAAGMK